jgi:phosphoribosyl 1,2-cyclic phosphodiesterase
VRFSVLGSGSKGNCTLVEAGSTRLLIDNGFSGKELKARLHGLGIAPDTLSGIVVTHEHHDHIQGIGVMARHQHLPVYANVRTHRAAESRIGPLPLRREFETGESLEIGDLQVHPFAVSHDTADPVGFVLSDGEYHFGYCTDTGKITQLIRHHLRRCQALVLEANHDVQLLKDGPYPLPLKQRVLSSQGHLANTDALEFASWLAEDRLRCLVLAHLSEINNHPELVRAEIRRHLSGTASFQVHIAEQRRPSPLMELAP